MNSDTKILLNCKIVLATAIVLLLASVAWAEPGSCAEESFSVVVLADTQFYSEKYPDNYLAQTEWIAQRVEADRIRFVVHLGDIVQNAKVEQEWINADRAHRMLDDVVPYGVLPGNHDLESVDKKLTRGCTLYNQYFGPKRFQKHPWYGGHRGETNANNYCFFEAAGMKFMVLGLEFSPDDATLRWADGVINAHPTHRVLVTTHCYMRPDGRDQTTNKFQGLPGNSGEAIWDKFVRKHPNIFMVLGGHVLGVNCQTSTNDAGTPVHEILNDYQGLPNGGNGWLRILRFAPKENRIRVEAYSPLLDEHNKDPKHTYTLEYPMEPAKLKKAG